MKQPASKLKQSDAGAGSGGGADASAQNAPKPAVEVTAPAPDKAAQKASPRTADRAVAEEVIMAAPDASAPDVSAPGAGGVPAAAGASAATPNGAPAGAPSGAPTGPSNNGAAGGPNGSAPGAAANGSGIQLDPGISALSHVPVEVQVVLGGARMPIGNVLKLSRGAVVEIDRKVGEQVDIHINNRPVARGEIIIVDEDRLGVTLTEIINVQAGLR